MTNRTFILDNITLKGSIQLELPVPDPVVEYPSFDLIQVGDIWNTPNPSSAGNFGYSISASQNSILVGSPYETVNGLAGAGKAYIFLLKDGVWALADTLTANVPQAGAGFGWSVSLFYNRCAIGAPFENNNKGAVYGFSKTNISTTWRHIDSLSGWFAVPDSTYETSSKYGWSVIFQGNMLIIGAPDAFGGSSDGTKRGAVYHYSFNPFGNQITYLDKLIPPQWKDGGKFGFSIGLMEEYTLAISAPYENVNYNGTKTNAGTVYVFTKSSDTTWFHQTRLISPNPRYNANFGYSIDLTMGRLIVGEPNDGYGGNAHVWEGYGPTWTYITTLNARESTGVIVDNTVTGSDNQGYLVKQDVLTNTILVSSPNNNNGKGCIYAYERTNDSWVAGYNDKIVPNGTANGDNFGLSFNFLADTVIGASPGRTSGDGAFYILSKNPSLPTEPITNFSDETHTYVYVPTNLTNNNNFGNAVAIRQLRATISAPGTTVGGTTNAGTVYMYHMVSHTLIPEIAITSPDPNETRFFGKAVAMTNNGLFLVIGCTNHINQERAYLYTYDSDVQTWVQRARIDFPPDHYEIGNTLFGSSIAFYGSTLLIGAPNALGNNTIDTTQRGAVFHYHVDLSTKVTTFVTKISPSDWELANGSQFGSSISLFGENLVAIGAPSHAGSSMVNSGAVYIYSMSSNGSYIEWIPKTIITSIDPASYAFFGTSVSLQNGRLAIGEPSNGSRIGNVSIWEGSDSSWSQVVCFQSLQTGGSITDTLVTANDRQGCQVVLTTDKLVIGSKNYNSNQGCVYVYTFDQGSWVPAPTEKLIPQDTTSGNNNFAYALDSNGSNLVVGSPSRNYGAGGAYIFNIE